jgi:hypothetical protein
VHAWINEPLARKSGSIVPPRKNNLMRLILVRPSLIYRNFEGKV